MAKMVCSTSSIPSLTSFCNSRQWATKPRFNAIPLSSFFLPLHNFQRRPISLQTATRAFGNNKAAPKTNENENKQEPEEEEVEVEEDIPWIQEKALDFVEFSGSVTQAIPGPRVGQTSLPWFLAVPLAFLGITFVTSLVKTVRKFTSPRAQRRKLIGKNAMLNKTIDELFEKGRDAVEYSALEDIVKKTGFGMEDVLRKYLRYAFNDKPFNGDTVADLIQLRKASLLTDSQVAEILNEISRRIVRDKGPVVMDATGYTEKGFKRKLAVQALFGKVFYLSELPEFCSRDSSLIVKEIFGVTDEDADKLRIQTLSNSGDIEALEMMMGDGSDPEDDGNDGED
ncbi:Leukotoxin [Bienertia sinuspersici]